MLDTVAQLAQDFVRHVIRILRAEIHADALGTDDPHHLLHPLTQSRRRIVKKQMGFVEEENQLRLVEVADLRQVLEQLGQQPQQKARVQAWFQYELVRGKDVDDAAPAEIGAHQVIEFQRRLAEERFAALAFQ